MPVRVLPKPTVSRDGATHLAYAHGWQYHDLFLADGEQPFEKVWMTEDGSTSIHWIEDPVLELSYLAVDGERQDEIADALRAELETFSRDELRASLEAASEWFDFLPALHHVAAAAPPSSTARSSSGSSAGSRTRSRRCARCRRS